MSGNERVSRTSQITVRSAPASTPYHHARVLNRDILALLLCSYIFFLFVRQLLDTLTNALLSFLLAAALLHVPSHHRVAYLA
jgi:hypothetical protein